LRFRCGRLGVATGLLRRRRLGVATGLLRRRRLGVATGLLRGRRLGVATRLLRGRRLGAGLGLGRQAAGRGRWIVRCARRRRRSSRRRFRAWRRSWWLLEHRHPTDHRLLPGGQCGLLRCRIGRGGWLRCGGCGGCCYRLRLRRGCRWHRGRSSLGDRRWLRCSGYCRSRPDGGIGLGRWLGFFLGLVGDDRRVPQGLLDLGRLEGNGGREMRPATCQLGRSCLGSLVCLGRGPEALGALHDLLAGAGPSSRLWWCGLRGSGLRLLCLIGLEGLFDRLPDFLGLEGDGGRQVRSAHSLRSCRPARLGRGGWLDWRGCREGLTLRRLGRRGRLGNDPFQLLLELGRFEGDGGPERRLATLLGRPGGGGRRDLAVALGGGCGRWLWRRCRRGRGTSTHGTHGLIERRLRLAGGLEGHRCGQPPLARLPGLTLGRLGGDGRHALRCLLRVLLGRCGRCGRRGRRGRCGWLSGSNVGRRGRLGASQMGGERSADHRLLDGCPPARRSRASQWLQSRSRGARSWRRRLTRCGGGRGRWGIPCRRGGRLPWRSLTWGVVGLIAHRRGGHLTTFRPQCTNCPQRPVAARSCLGVPLRPGG